MKSNRGTIHIRKLNVKSIKGKEIKGADERKGREGEERGYTGIQWRF